MKTKPNYKLKSMALAFNESYHVIECLSTINFLDYLQESNPTVYFIELQRRHNYYTLVYDTLKQAQSTNKVLFHECEKIYNADCSRKKRLRNRIQYMFDTCEDVIFVTLTFTDSFLDRSTDAYRREVVTRWLKNCCPSDIYIPYVANIDFGYCNEREHYHGLIGCKVPKDMLKFWRENYGEQIKLETVHKTLNDRNALSTYISKLVNHAVKETTKRNHLIYSRESKSKNK